MIKTLKLIPGKQLWIFQAYDQGFGFSESLWTSNFYQFHGKKKTEKTETERKLRSMEKKICSLQECLIHLSETVS